MSILWNRPDMYITCRIESISLMIICLCVIVNKIKNNHFFDKRKFENVFIILINYLGFAILVTYKQIVVSPNTVKLIPAFSELSKIGLNV